jgi:hypothetical protein
MGGGAGLLQPRAEASNTIARAVIGLVTLVRISSYSPLKRCHRSSAARANASRRERAKQTAEAWFVGLQELFRSATGTRLLLDNPMNSVVVLPAVV